VNGPQYTLNILIELQFSFNDDKFNHLVNLLKISISRTTAINLLQKPHLFLEEVARLFSFQSSSHLPSQYQIVNIEIFKTHSNSINACLKAMINNLTQLYANHLTNTQDLVNHNSIFQQNTKVDLNSFLDISQVENEATDSQQKNEILIAVEFVRIFKEDLKIHLTMHSLNSNP
jgi:hypothetical protein